MNFIIFILTPLEGPLDQVNPFSSYSRLFSGFYENMKFQLVLIISAFYDALIIWITLILLSSTHRWWLNVNKMWNA